MKSIHLIASFYYKSIAILTITIATVILIYGTDVSIRVMLTCCWPPTTPAFENVHQLRHDERDLYIINSGWRVISFRRPSATST